MANSTRLASTTVREVIERDGVVRHGLYRGLINAHALARSIQLSTIGPGHVFILVHEMNATNTYQALNTMNR